MRVQEEIQLILATSWRPDRAQFFSKLKIDPDGFAGRFFEGVFESLFTDAIDARREFEAYYSVEYGTMERYLDGRYGVVLKEGDAEKQYIFLCTWLATVLDENYDDSKRHEVLAIIRELEVEHEDQS